MRHLWCWEKEMRETNAEMELEWDFLDLPSEDESSKPSAKGEEE
jgi:hypothetical protein